MEESKKNKLIKHWIKGSEIDFQAVKDISDNTKSYVQALFFLHLSIEKAIKALYVSKFNEHAPFSHGLLYLAEKCQLQLDDEKEELLSEINEFNLEARYPDEHYELHQKATQNFTLNYVKEGEKVRQWILEKLKD